MGFQTGRKGAVGGPRILTCHLGARLILVNALLLGTIPASYRCFTLASRSA